MKVLKRIFHYKTLLILMGILVLLLFSSRFFNFAANQEEIDEAFSKIEFDYQYQNLEFEEGNLHFVTIGDSTLPTLFLIHGSPGSWDAWLSLCTQTNILHKFYVIAIDRPGYNKTTLEGIYSLKDQSRFIKPLIEKYCDSCLLAGHSYGGGLAMQIALDYPETIKGVASISGTVAFPHQKLKWFNYAMNYSPAQWLVSEELATSNREMWQLQNDLPSMNSSLGNYKGKVAIIQGEKDRIVDAKSASYLQQKLENAELKMFVKEDMDHFVIWTNMELVIEAIDWLK
tara:strand:- start:22860 stop:23714 length:855 start_codon:yes stop_codon:yes gene_type:complete